MKTPRLLLHSRFRTSRRYPSGWLAGKRVLITGASSGIGAATARLLGAGGAHVLLVARREHEIAELADQITAAGGSAAYAVADLTVPEQVDKVIAWVADTFGHVDVLINNAGRSIRRPVLDAVDRFHDYERTMAINYFAAVRLTLGLLPAMRTQGSGQVVNVGTWGVGFETSPYFSAYLASKTALVTFGRCLDAELSRDGIRVSAVNFPSVRTAMLAPTGKYAAQHALTPEEAARWIAVAIRKQPVRIEPWAVHGVRLVGLFSPRTAARLLVASGI
ncbi:SDR family NAD(P)-dependent oxidoreductase [Nocardia cyriacigeorgica]|uniref:SDR family NAD(P)-dependent oxidoreductase n=1 Tax=Nocardia cyriacigeorgica TaxID=135487 RepID=UPI001892FAEC|nr:SDR family NAD(P)-dependent oxidoreductase [Nocardia cyriacigeorgica]MBF6436587.1 SDR family NAD(P)-dependent oxidoreductase [Nocardia cyriacigeorgica]MBF6452156.1 SDR family NAD(P)-dependent oxidoreductase [Nocardia cyriacigeorgica]MBF6477503.1 SDR family NAD(P)-dependent oxidoreductase [Nocardia cyriacigeorgica]MBF6549325.1 SDR family NAD(P)-dependent oxidoreductase [Nocardia cyriacigeorgica]